MPLQPVEVLDGPPIVGTRYLVPTVLYPWFGVDDAWPVMGPKHTDAEHIGFDHEHYHVDIRFLSDLQVRRIERKAGRDIESVVATNPLATRGLGLGNVEHPEPVRKRLTCRRPDHDFPLWFARGQRWHKALTGAYAGRKCGRNADGALVCPHKGFVLDSLQPDEHGRIVCPLHGLVIDVEAAAVVGAEAKA